MGDNRVMKILCQVVVLCAYVAGQLAFGAAPVKGWLSWRGPSQSGMSLEKGLPDKIDGKQALWTAEYPGQSTPVIANGKLYIMGLSRRWA
jgi:hypothetical protein